jgi:hypothetical protein
MFEERDGAGGRRKTKRGRSPIGGGGGIAVYTGRNWQGAAYGALGRVRGRTVHCIRIVGSLEPGRARRVFGAHIVRIVSMKPLYPCLLAFPVWRPLL